MDEKFLKAMHPVTAILHWKVLSILKQYDIESVLDVGGVGKMEQLSSYKITNANIIYGIDGCALPYEDNQFDAVVSIATLEHVHDQAKFLEECERVTRKASIHWFPCGRFAEEAERLKSKYGHYHPCRLPNTNVLTEGGETRCVFMNCGEHMLLCMTLTPSLKAPEVYDFIMENYDNPYGFLLIGEK